jgi:hypothetical protein
VRADARQFQFPPEPFVIFLYNPFSGDIFRSAMQQLTQHPSNLYIVYINPLHSELLSADARMKMVASDDWWCTIWKLHDGKA